jgi:hypothetical protein
LKIRRRALIELIIYAVGVILGVAWLLPAYNHPLHKANPSSIETLRFLRIFLPAVVSIIVAFFIGYKRRVVIPDILLFFTFFAWPLVIWASTGMGVDRFLIINLPLALSFVTIIGFSLWPIWTIRQLFKGVGSTAAFLIIYRVAQYGVELNTFYFRPRAHLGFDHPLVTAGALFSAACAMLLFLDSMKSVALKRLLAAALIVGFFILMFKVDSRNMLIFSCVIVTISLMSLIPLQPSCWQTLNFLLMAVWFILTITALHLAAAGRLGNPVHNSGIGRIESFLNTAEFMSNDLYVISGRQAEFYQAFAATDSIFTSFWIHFGLVGLLSLLSLLAVIGHGLTGVRPAGTLELIARGGLWALIVFYMLDAQGLTAANFAVFGVLILCYRFSCKTHVCLQQDDYGTCQIKPQKNIP